MVILTRAWAPCFGFSKEKFDNLKKRFFVALEKNKMKIKSRRRPKPKLAFSLSRIDIFDFFVVSDFHLFCCISFPGIGALKNNNGNSSFLTRLLNLVRKNLYVTQSTLEAQFYHIRFKTNILISQTK